MIQGQRFGLNRSIEECWAFDKVMLDTHSITLKPQFRPKGIVKCKRERPTRVRKHHTGPRSGGG